MFRTYANARHLLFDVVDAGFKLLWAMEDESGAMDHRDIRREFGDSLRLIGGIDLDRIFQSERAMQHELDEWVRAEWPGAATFPWRTGASAIPCPRPPRLPGMTGGVKTLPPLRQAGHAAPGIPSPDWPRGPLNVWIQVTSCINGRFDHAYPLTSQMLAFSWPLPHGPLLTPRVLSNAADAPLLGEACILFNLTRLAHPGVDIVSGGRIPGIVYVALALYLFLGLVLAASAIRSFRRWRREHQIAIVSGERFQLLVWAGCVASAMIQLAAHRTGWAVGTLLLAQLLPKNSAP